VSAGRFWEAPSWKSTDPANQGWDLQDLSEEIDQNQISAEFTYRLGVLQLQIDEPNNQLTSDTKCKIPLATANRA
jgi:hypothetical protein